jgi:hypothetical protein
MLPFRELFSRRSVQSENIMVILLATAIAFLLPKDEMPFQIIPRSQFGFKVTENIKDSPEGEKYGMFVVNDEYTPNTLLETVEKKETRSTLVELVRKGADGNLEFWNPDGTRITNSPYKFGKDDIESIKDGEIAAVVDNTYAFENLSSPKDKPRQDLNLRASRVSSLLNSNPGHFVVFKRLSKPTSTFVNLRFSISVEVYVGSVKPVPGSNAKVDGIDFKAIGPIESKDPKVVHFEFSQGEIPRRLSYLLVPAFDWVEYEKANGKQEDRELESMQRPVKGSASITDGYRIDLSMNKPFKYVKSICIVRVSSVDGYFGHVATEPIGK